MDTFEEFSRSAREAAASVGPYLVDAFSGCQTVALKADIHDPVTEHDRESQRRIVDALFQMHPDCLVVGEEANELLSRSGTVSSITDDDVVWYVDPIDGTSNFAAGFDHWAVSIAAARAGQLLACALYQPTRGVMFHADSTGAFRNGEPIHVSTAPVSQGIIGTEFPSVRLPDPQKGAEGFQHILRESRSVRRTGSTALMLAEVACGHFTATFNVGTHPWDVAAGALLVERAGGHYIGHEAGAPFTRNAVHAANYVASGTRKGAVVCLRASGHPDPEGAADSVWGAR